MHARRLRSARLHGNIYALLRPTLGVMTSFIHVWSGRSDHHRGVLYSDGRTPLPIPRGQDLDDYRLANGLHVRVPPTHGGYRYYQIDFEG